MTTDQHHTEPNREPGGSEIRIDHQYEHNAPLAIETNYPIAAADLVRLRGRLTRRAHDRELLEVSYRMVDSPVGRLLLATTRQGLVRVAFETEGFDAVLVSLATSLSPRVLEDPGALDPVALELEEYFAGGRQKFDLPLDHSLSAGFRLTVHQLLPEIAYGHTWSYQEMAARAGNPRAVRAVGTACGRNPLPLVVPCHRVLRSDGSLGGYLGGLSAKHHLLELEHTVTSRAGEGNPERMQ